MTTVKKNMVSAAARGSARIPPARFRDTGASFFLLLWAACGAFILCAGCHRVPRAEPDYDAGDPIGVLAARFGTVQDPIIVSWVRDVAAKVEKGGRAVAARGAKELRVTRPEMWVVKDKEPNAYSFPPNLIALTTGLLCGVNYEDELAAVVAHESAHLWLGHRQAERDATGVASAASVVVDRNRELEADAVSLELLRAAGYLPGGAVRALMLLTYRRRAELSPAQRDLIDERIHTMSSRIGAVGTLVRARNSRAFSEFLIAREPLCTSPSQPPRDL